MTVRHAPWPQGLARPAPFAKSEVRFEPWDLRNDGLPRYSRSCGRRPDRHDAPQRVYRVVVIIAGEVRRNVSAWYCASHLPPALALVWRALLATLLGRWGWR